MPGMLTEAKWTDALKDAYYKEHPENFAGPHKSYPIKDASDVPDAWGLAGQADDPDAVRAKIKSIASRLGFSHALPDTAKEESFRPQKKIATLPVCWLEYNARSWNGRIYPKVTCDRIYGAAQRKIADPNSVGATCFVSHEAANSNVNTQLVGGVSRVWQEDSKFWADLDFADTSTARDMLGLAEGKYLRCISMRVLGVELKQDPNYDLPIVVIPEGIEPELLGIDLTTRPGLMDTARIQQVLYESQEAPEIYTENFALNDISITKEMPMSIPLYLQILTEAMTPDREAHGRIHDHLAGVLDECVKPMHGQESARFIAGVLLSEEGRALAMKHATRLAAAHDESAKTLGMTCEGTYNEALGIAPSDKDQDGDNPATGNDPDQDNQSATGGNNIMTEQEALALLKSKGYNVAPPKTAEEQITELKTMLEAQQQEIAALKTAPPQRQTQALTPMTEQQTYLPETMYADGDLLKGALHPRHWEALAGHGTKQLRDVPWPKDVDPWAAVHELAPIVALGICEQQARATNQQVSAYIRPDEEV